MANVGSGAAGQTYIGAGNGASGTYKPIGTNSGLVAHGVVLSQNLGAFNSIVPGAAGTVFTSNGPTLDPSWVSTSSSFPIGALEYFANAAGDAYLSPNWLKCDGSIYAQATYTTLFARVGLLNPGGNIWEFSQASPPSGGATAILGLVYGSKFVFLANGGGANQIGTSTNGISWSTVNGSPPSSGSSGTALGYGNGIYLASYNTPNGLSTSTNATNWITQVPATELVSYGNSLLFSTGGSGYDIYTSTDNINWTLSTVSSPFFINSAFRYENNLFLLAQDTQIATSTNGAVWSTYASGSSLRIRDFTYGSVYVYVGGSVSTAKVGTSTDAITWTLGTPAATSNNLNAVAYGASTYVYAGDNGKLATSTDAITWTIHSIGTGLNVYALVYGSVFVYACDSGRLGTSTDAITWTVRTSNTTSSILSLSYGNSTYVYCGAGGVVASSTDAITWTVRTSNTTIDLNRVTYGTNFYAKGVGVSLTSTDGTTWTTPAVIPTTESVSAITYGNSLYIAGCDSGNIYTSTNALTWTVRTSRTTTHISALTYGDSLYMYADLAGINATSTDGITWTPGTITATNISYLSYGNSLFLGVENNQIASVGGGYVITSTDAVTWTATPIYTTNTPFSLIYGNNLYVLGYLNGYIYTSTDLITFNGVITSTTINDNSKNYLAYGNSYYVSAGDNIYYSSGTYSYNSTTSFQVPTDAQLGITLEYPNNFKRSLYIRAL